MRFFILAAALLISFESSAVIRPIFVPDKQTLILIQQMSAGFPDDPTARELFQAIALPSQDGPGGGKGKVIATETKDFNLACANRKVFTDNYMCTIAMKPSARTVMDWK